MGFLWFGKKKKGTDPEAELGKTLTSNEDAVSSASEDEISTSDKADVKENNEAEENATAEATETAPKSDNVIQAEEDVKEMKKENAKATATETPKEVKSESKKSVKTNAAKTVKADAATAKAETKKAETVKSTAKAEPAKDVKANADKKAKTDSSKPANPKNVKSEIPQEEAPAPVKPEPKIGKYICKMTRNDAYIFRLKASNGETITTSGTYTTKASMEKGIDSIARNAPLANVEDQTVADYEVKPNPKFEIYIDKSGEYRFRLKARNGQIISVSQGYSTKANCKNGAESVKKNACAPIIYEDN